MTVLVALMLSASACAVILGIDDVNVRDAGDSGTDASADGARDGSIPDARTDAKPLKPYLDEVSNDHPIAYWRLDDHNADAVNASGFDYGTYGDTITHTDGGGLIFDPQNDVAAIFPGLPDGSLQSQGVSIAKDSTFEDGGVALTIEVWVEPLAEYADNRIGELVSYGSSASAPFEAWALKSVPPHVVLYTSCCGQVSNKMQLATGSTYHLVATFDHGVQNIYVNGLPDSDPSSPGSNLLFDGSTDGLGIGATWAGYNPFNGILDEVAVYDYVLPLVRIQAHYQAGKKP
ncbi:MAG: LamG domain-containing protein [Polyangiaceae bacterium]